MLNSPRLPYTMYKVSNGAVQPVTVGDDDDDFVNGNAVGGVDIENDDFVVKPFPKKGLL